MYTSIAAFDKYLSPNFGLKSSHHAALQIRHFIDTGRFQLALYMIDFYLRSYLRKKKGDQSDFVDVIFLLRNEIIELLQVKDLIELSEELNFNWHDKFLWEEHISFDNHEDIIPQKAHFLFLAGQEGDGIYSKSCMLNKFIQKNSIGPESLRGNHFTFGGLGEIHLIRRVENSNFIDYEGALEDFGSFLINKLSYQGNKLPKETIYIYPLGFDIEPNKTTKRRVADKMIVILVEQILWMDKKKLDYRIVIPVDEEEKRFFISSLKKIQQIFEQANDAYFEKYYNSRDEFPDQAYEHVIPTIVEDFSWGKEFLGFETSNLKLKHDIERIKMCLEDEDPVLLLGETGVGKTYIAERIHKFSKTWSKGEFIQLNCAALPSELVESELFGYRKGAFTGATRDYEGMIKLANGGVLFLDEIGEAPLSMQAKLLTFLESRMFYGLGGKVEKKVKLKIIFATSKNIEELMAKKLFLPELYYRICANEITIPPLREREGDLSDIIKIETKKICENLKKMNYLKDGDVEFSDEAITELWTYPWTGNYRQLKDALKFYIKEADRINERIVDLSLIETRPLRSYPVPGKISVDYLMDVLKSYFFEWDKKIKNSKEEIHENYRQRLILENDPKQKNVLEEKEHGKNPLNFLDGFIKPLLQEIYKNNNEEITEKIANAHDISYSLGILPTKGNKKFLLNEVLYEFIRRSFI